MAESLVIVESPAKAKTIGKFLGRGYRVVSSKGHVRDLPKNWRPKDFDDASKPPYVVLEDREKLIDDIVGQAAKAERVIIATDPDREGEAIGWHLAEVLQERGALERAEGTAPVLRVMFNEITKNAVTAAMQHATQAATQIDRRRVDAQQARRVIDRLMGYNLSPLLWEKVMRGLSGGRVQSVALRLVCEREDAIEAFVPQEYWNVTARLQKGGPPPFSARLKRRGKDDLGPRSAEEVETIRKALEGAKWTVAQLDVKERRPKPPAPYITSKFQQDASRSGMPVRRAMQVAQALYEGKEVGERGQVGLITYMRTDSTRVSEAAITDVRAYVSTTMGPDYVPEKPNVHATKGGAQDAHEAIRPTYMDLPPERVAQYLTREELRIYRLIWNRFVASQMKPAIFEDTTVTVQAGPHVFEAKGSVEKFAGYLRAYRAAKSPDEQDAIEADDSPEAEDQEGRLPRLSVGDVLDLLQLDTEQKFTQPEPRYTEATLVKALEENGIGRPSTYAAILDTLGAREYTHKKEGRFHPSRLGRMVNKLLVGSFEDLIQVGYTARLEKELDGIEEDRLHWLDALREFNGKFMDDLQRAKTSMPDVRGGISMTPKITCDKCGKEMKLRFGRFGDFLACSAYPECKNTRDLLPEALQGVEVPCPVCAKIMSVRTGQFGAYLQCKDYPGCPGRARLKELPDGTWVPVIDKRLDETCPRCGSILLEREGRNGTFVSCSGYPKCDYIKQEKLGIACPRDAGDLVVKRSRRGKPFYGCGNWPACEFVAFDKPLPQPCPACAAPFILEKTTKKFGTYHYCHREECPWTDAPAGAPPVRKAAANAPPRRPTTARGAAARGRGAVSRRGKPAAGPGRKRAAASTPKA